MTLHKIPEERNNKPLSTIYNQMLEFSHVKMWIAMLKYWLVQYILIVMLISYFSQSKHLHKTYVRKQARLNKKKPNFTKLVLLFWKCWLCSFVNVYLIWMISWLGLAWLIFVFVICNIVGIALYSTIEQNFKKLINETSNFKEISYMYVWEVESTVSQHSFVWSNEWMKRWIYILCCDNSNSNWHALFFMLQEIFLALIQLKCRFRKRIISKEL